jgi:hypothetical protein
VIAEKRHAQEVFGGPLVVRAGGLGAEVLPIIEVTVAAAEPGQGDQVDLLVLVEAED